MGKEIDHLKERRAEERTFKIESAQFKQLDDNFDGLNGAINKLAARISDADKNKTLHQAITDGFTKLVAAIDAQTKDHGKWEHIKTYAIAEGLAAIALAASTPTDNSEEVRALTAKLKSSTDELEAAVNAAPKQGETQ